MKFNKKQNYLKIHVESLDYDDNYRGNIFYCHALEPMEIRDSHDSIVDSDILSADLNGSPVLYFTSNNKNIDEPFIKQLPIDCICEIGSVCCRNDKSSSYCGKILVTFMLDGMIKEIKCDEIQKKKGKLVLINTKTVEVTNKKEEHVESSGILNVNAIELLGNKKTMNFDDFNLVRIEPYPEPYVINKDYVEGRYDLPFGKISGKIFIINKSIHIVQPQTLGSITSCSGKIEFCSITEMINQIAIWKRWNKEGLYPFQMSDIEYDDNCRIGSFTLYSDTLTYADLETLFGFEVSVSKYIRRDNDSYNEIKKWCGDAYEGYSSEYLGLD